jgi:hypothetical protein
LTLCGFVCQVSCAGDQWGAAAVGSWCFQLQVCRQYWSI